MEDLISIENLIKEATDRGIDFGKGDPYNRLRYYTKIGWLPHMLRKKDENGDIKGHYALWSVERLILIEQLKAKGLTNEEISKKLTVKNKVQQAYTLVTTKESRNQLIAYATLAILTLVFANELGIIKLGRSKETLNSEVYTNLNTAPRQIIDSGVAFMPKGQKKVFINSPLIKASYKVYVTFNQNYSPAARFWVGDINDFRGFNVELDTQTFENAEFSWWLTN
jgi:hypothetical protein